MGRLERIIQIDEELEMLEDMVNQYGHSDFINGTLTQAMTTLMEERDKLAEGTVSEDD